jgi:cytochrome bd-type quinol oxidase subunit 1
MPTPQSTARFVGSERCGQSYLTGAFCVAATVLRRVFHAEARIMLRMGLTLAAVLLPFQLLFGHLNGEYVVHHQPSKSIKSVSAHH